MKLPDFSGALPELDLTRADHLDAVQTMANELLARYSGEQLFELEGTATERRGAVPLSAQTALKIALARARLLRLASPRQVSVVFAVYKEHHRILTRAEHPHGEDFLRRKLAQLAWLFADTPHEWELIVVDDGCPEGSGNLAQEIIASEGAASRARVLFLRDAIAAGHPAIRGISDTSESQKGGSILYGMFEAAGAGRPARIVAFTDADLSTHLGQLGLLVSAIDGGADAAIGSRRESRSVVVKKGKRNTRGKLFIYLWKQMLPPLRVVTDTQCGFKAFRADVLADILADTIERRFAFDIELLLKTLLRRPDSIAKVPVAWIDSEAASTTTALQPYLAMLQSAAAMYRRYLPPAERGEAFASFIENLDDDGWSRLVDEVPPAIGDAEPSQFGDALLVTVDELAAIAGVR